MSINPSPSPRHRQKDVSGHSGHALPPGGCQACARLRDMITQLQQEKEKALQEQREAFQKQLAETAQSRRHLEEERLALLRQEFLQKREGDLQRVRQSWEAESVKATGLAYQEGLREAEKARERELQAWREAEEVRFGERLKGALSAAAAEGQKRAEGQKETQGQKHAEQVKLLQEKLSAVQEQLNKVTQEKTDFECKFKEIQLNYKRFIDLTDSSLHSDYLLRLIHLGKPPGYVHSATQTDDVIKPSC
ncbi:trichohyalin-like [Xenopus tropicalis]|uniref:Trichohyalin-like n=1 Tax=Xenopus tropicalis TaxID=8364 RepID=A0A8J1JC22_XENTR|nr:trichohyalin-like [Xenopus tropicalis]